MASFDAISVIANTLLGVLANNRPPNRFAGASFQLFRATNLQSASAQISHGMSIYLHRVSFNTQRRNHPPRVDLVTGRRFRPPTPVDLHFLMTAWGRGPEEQMDILGWAIRTMQDTMQLPAGLLNRFAGDLSARFPNGERSAVFAENEAVELVGEVLSAQELVNIWEVSKANQQPSISYVARQVLIDSETEFPDAALVQTREFDYAKLISHERVSATAR